MKHGLISLTAAVPAALALLAPGASASGFSATVDNPWFPLKPGTTLVYKGVKDGKPQRDVFHVTTRTKVVHGARCVVVDDRVYSGGHLSEKTLDYYTQDANGNVWYYGEDTAELNAKGQVTSREGTWRAGVKGARPGIFMPAHPRVGDGGFQEFWKGHAEDRFSILSTRASVKVPYGSFRQAIRTKETSPLEPGVVDNKYYVRGIGQVFEGAVKGAKETARLVSITHG
jgi:hypothetical protein